MAKGIFERELKGILQGDLEILDRVTRTCDPEEATNYKRICRSPFIVMRAAGSFGVDLMALRSDIGFPIEVKSSKSRTLRFSKSIRVTNQAEDMIEKCGKAGLVPIYAFRLKGQRGDAWRLFTLPIRKHFEGQQRVLYKRLPKAKITPKDYFVLKWEDGFPLNEFIDYICSD
ncbi:MAG: Holliday junction resolvase [Thermoplasmata archaeon]